MKISWGTKIAVLYLSFVALIVTLVSLCMNQKVELESKDYYAQELAFQNKINATANANALKQNIEYRISNNNIELIAPQELMKAGIQGKVILNRPSDSQLDKEFNLQFGNDGKQLIEGNNLKRGAYKIQLSWSSNHVDYYKEGIINIK